MDTAVFESDFQLIVNSIRKLEIRNDFIFFPESHDLSRYFDVESEIISIDEDENEFSGLLKLCLIVEVTEKEPKIKETNGRKPGFYLNLELLGLFKDASGGDKEGFIDLLSLNGSAALYGIARSLVISLSSQSALYAQVILPMVNFFKMKKLEETE